MLAHGLINTGKKKPINGIENHKPYMGITSSPLPQNNGNLPLPFFSGKTQFFSCVIRIDDCI